MSSFRNVASALSFTGKGFALMTIALSIMCNAACGQTGCDSLNTTDYATLRKHFFDHRADKPKALQYANAWLRKAKEADNYEQAASAYKAMSYVCAPQKSLIYLGSMVESARNTRSDRTIGSAYLSKGIALYNNIQNRSALDHYIVADRYISKTKDQYLSFTVKYQIAQTKYQLGFYDEAIALLRQCIPYFEQENDLAYLNSLYALGLCYTSISKYEESTRTNELGIFVSRELELTELLPYFALSNGINDFYRGRPQTAIAAIRRVLPQITNKQDKATETAAHFYIAKSFWALGEKASAIPYLQKIDEAFDQHRYIRPDLLETYTLLINFYKATRNPSRQMFYMDRFIKADSVMSGDYKYLSGKILRKYDTKEIRLEKQQLERSMYNQKVKGVMIIAALSAMVALLFYRHRKLKAGYHQKFEELMRDKSTGTDKVATAPVPYSEAKLGFGQELAQTLLLRLEEFEKKRLFTQPEMSLTKLASILKTITKYTTKILAHYRGKGYIEYISDLRIDYIVKKLHTDKKFRLYKNESLSNEAGFGSTQIFTRTFRKKIGMPPTVFIAELLQSAE